MKRTKRKPYGRQTVARDAHNPTQVFVETVTNDQPVIEHNTKVRNAGLVTRGQRLPVIDEHAEVTASFQFPSQMDFQLAKARYPDEFAKLELGGDDAIRAGERLAVLIPQYVTMVKRGDRL